MIWHCEHQDEFILQNTLLSLLVVDHAIFKSALRASSGTLHRIPLSEVQLHQGASPSPWLPYENALHPLGTNDSDGMPSHLCNPEASKTKHRACSDQFHGEQNHVMGSASYRCCGYC
mmetsp:Transcript_51445/g.122320  ORF Transcript_51445/g.122320 Transcript_51445/m.122320 type:complete len:117 (-) Transcript_51445:1035-1385(-)